MIKPVDETTVVLWYTLGTMVAVALFVWAGIVAYGWAGRTHQWHTWQDTNTIEARPTSAVKDATTRMMRLQRCEHCAAEQWRMMGW